jgi:hypothetical protein
LKDLIREGAVGHQDKETHSTGQDEQHLEVAQNKVQAHYVAAAGKELSNSLVAPDKIKTIADSGNKNDTGIKVAAGFIPQFSGSENNGNNYPEYSPFK